MTHIIIPSGGYLSLPNDLPLAILPSLVASRPLLSAIAPHLMPDFSVQAPVPDVAAAAAAANEELQDISNSDGGEDDDDDDGSNPPPNFVIVKNPALCKLSKGTLLGAFFLRFAESCVFAQHLTVGNTPGLPLLPQMCPYLKSISFSFSADCGAEDLSCLGSLRMLHTLELTWATVTDKNLLQLARAGVAERLRACEFTRLGSVTDAGMGQFFAHAPRLEKLSLCDCGPGVTFITLQALAAGPISISARADSSSSARRPPCRLRSLTLSDSTPSFNFLTEESLGAVCETFAHTLTFLSLTSHQSGFGDVAMKCVKDLPALETLEVSARRITAEGWEQASTSQGLLHLRSLKAKPHHGVRDDHLEKLSHFVALEELALSYAQMVTDAGMLHLVNSGSHELIKILRMSIGANVTGRFFHHLSANCWPVLHTLDLHFIGETTAPQPPRSTSRCLASCAGCASCAPDAAKKNTEDPAIARNSERLQVLLENLIDNDQLRKQIRDLRIFGANFNLLPKHLDLICRFDNLRNLSLMRCKHFVSYPEQLATLKLLKHLHHLEMFSGTHLLPIEPAQL